MAKVVKRTEITEDDIFKNARESARETIKVVEKLNGEFKETAGLLKNELKNAKLGNTAEIEKFVKATQKAQKLQKDSIKLKKVNKDATEQLNTANKDLAKTKAQEMKTERELLKETRLLNAEKERGKKVAEKQAKALKDETSAYKLLVKKTRDQKNASKELAATLLQLEANGKKNTKEWRKMSGEYRKVTSAARKGDKALKKIDRTVGDNFRNVGNYKSALGGLTRVLSGLGLAFGGLSIIKGAGQTIVEFDKSIQDLRAITGASGADLEFFKEQAKSLGTQVEGGASKVIEAYKLIGSAKPELLKNAKALDAVTQSAITLSQASGLDLPDAATRLTDAMNQFGAPAEEAGKFINVLANGALFGSAAIPDVTDALLKFGAAANTSNVSLEESTALIEALASKGLKGAEAGTALRNVMLKLSAPDALPKEAQKAMAALGISFDDITDTSKPFAERLEAMKPLLQNNAAMVKVFGKENSIAATNLLNMTDEVKQLTSDMKTQGTVQAQAAQNTDTVAFAFNNLKETWNKFILDLDQGAGIGEKIKDVLGFLAENLETIVKTIGFAVKAFIAYKTIVKITAIQNRLLATSFGDIIKSKSGIKGAFAAMKSGIKSVGKALKANALGIALTALAWSLNAIRGESEKLNAVLSKTADNQRELDEATSEVTINMELEKAEAKALFAALGETNAESADRAALMKEINDKYGLTLENMEDETAWNEQNAAALKLVNLELEKKAKLAAAQIGFEITQKQAVEAKLAYEDAQRALSEFRAAGTGKWIIGALFDRLGAESENDLIKLSNAASSVWTNATEKADEYEKKWIDLQATLKTTEDDDGQDVPEIPPSGGNKSVDEYISLLRKIEDEQIKQITDDEDRKIKKLEADQRRRIEDIKLKKTHDDELADYIRETEETLTNDIQKVRDEAEEKRKVQREKTLQWLTAAAIKEKEIELGAIDDTVANEGAIAAKQDEIDALKTIQIEENREILLRQTENAAERADIIKAAQLKITQIEEDGAARRLALRQKQFERLNKQYDTAAKEYYLTLLNNQELTQAQIDAKMEAFEIEQLQKRIAIMKKNFPEMTDEILALEIELGEKQRAIRKREADKTNDELADAQKEHLERIAEISKAITDVYIYYADERIKKIDEEIDKATEQRAHLQRLAENGNIAASESLAEQNRIIAEANRAKEQEEKRKRTAELINAAVQTYTAKAADPTVEHPLLETIRDITLLTQFIQNMPAFLDGTEDTGTNGQGIDGKGGFQAILHPNERVLTKEQNQQIGGLTNVELAKVASEYNTGKLINGASGGIQIGGPWEQSAVIEQLQSLEQAVKDQNATFGVEHTLNDGFQWFTKTQKGNNVNFNRYKVKK